MKMSPPRHMTSDDAFPPKIPGKIRLYSMQYCPFAMRARLLLAKKGVEYETININLKDKPSWFLEIHPAGTTPALDINDNILGESLVVAEYVDEVFSKPGEQTFPTDPYEKARTRMLIANEFAKAISAVYKRLGRKEGWQEDFNTHVGKLDDILGKKKFFAGDAIGYADYMIWPWMRFIGPHMIDDVLPSGKFKNIERWMSDVVKDETIKKCHTRPEILAKHFEVYVTGIAVYDLEIASGE